MCLAQTLGVWEDVIERALGFEQCDPHLGGLSWKVISSRSENFVILDGETNVRKM
jgi:hypothetical protein